MTIATLYVRAKSKKALNDAIATGADVWFENYSLFGDSSSYCFPDNPPPNGAVIKIYDKVIGGSPYAKAYGNWDSKRGRVK